jgi:type I restriction enzyme S subunit
MAITIAANIAETAVLTYPACFPDSVVGFIADPKKADVRFIEYLFRVLRRKLQHENVGTGSVQDNINLQTLGRLDLYVPEIAEQRAIASVLAALDDKIDVNRRMNETVEAIARSLFKDWFVDFGPTRAKLEGGVPYLAPDAWALFPDRLDGEGKPEGWDFAKLGSLCARVAMGPFGSDITTDNFVSQGVPVVRGGNLKNGFIDYNFVYVTDEKADELRNANAFAQDVVITHRGTLGQVGIIPKKPVFARYVVSQSQMLLRADPEKATPQFAFEFLRSEFGMQQLLAFTSQVGVPAIARPTTALKSLDIIVPSRPIMLAFDNFLAPLVERENANSAEILSLEMTRDLLLPKLMSGEIRISDAENIAGAAQ